MNDEDIDADWSSMCVKKKKNEEKEHRRSNFPQ